MVKIFGHRQFIEIPGERSFELPPLMLRSCSDLGSIEVLIENAEWIIDSESLIPDNLQALPESDNTLSQVRFGLAVNLAEQYRTFIRHWTWGASVLEWIRQCETTFETQPNLRTLLHPDVWPHAGRSSFVTLLEDKQATEADIDLENAMGYRLTFRQPPPIEFFSEKFLFFLNASLAESAYKTWANASGEEKASLPPERFQFFVMTDNVRFV